MTNTLRKDKCKVSTNDWTFRIGHFFLASLERATRRTGKLNEAGLDSSRGLGNQCGWLFRDKIKAMAG